MVKTPSDSVFLLSHSESPPVKFLVLALGDLPERLREPHTPPELAGIVLMLMQDAHRNRLVLRDSERVVKCAPLLDGSLNPPFAHDGCPRTVLGLSGLRGETIGHDG